MAEAVAVVSLLASILQLIDFGSKLVERLNDFVATTKDVPETFRNISFQLPIAITTLQRLRCRIERSELSRNDSDALKALLDHSIDLIKDITGIIEKFIPAKTSSSLEKRLLALQSLRHDKKVQKASTQLLQNVNYLIFYQSTGIQDSAIDIAQRLSSADLSTTSYAKNFRHGLNLGGAPRLANGSFVGRDSELKQLNEMLDPDSLRQSLIAVVGMAGIGKTQLCIEYALSHAEQYTSIFWLNAQDESSLRADLLKVAEIILPDQTGLLNRGADENFLLQKIRRWFSHPENRKWLLILDNLDNPKVPGDDDPMSFDVRDYFPHRSQGLILITTRSRKITYAKQLHLQKLENVEQGLQILSLRSGRVFKGDRDAVNLVKRLDGLPLAIASAASFLERTSCTAKEYLDEYERNWLEEDSHYLFEYGDRTLFTTWNLSFEKLKSQSSESAEMLRMLAFFGSENIDHRLLAAQDSMLWPGLGDILRTKATFDRSMAKLRDYSLVETSHRSYRLHPCLHDWTLSNLNRQIKERDVWLALNCVVFTASSISSIWSTNYDESLSRLAPHALRLIHPRLFDVLMRSQLDESHSVLLCGLGQLLHRAERDRVAIQLVRRALEWFQEHLGSEHQNSLKACNILGTIYQELQNYAEAEALLKEAVFGLRRTVGKHNKATLDPVHNLALLYMRLNRLNDAHDMYLWSLRGCEEAYGPQDPNTFWATMALGDFYMAKDDLDQAEKEFYRALTGFDAAIDPDHFFSRFTAARLGAIYQQQGKHDSAVAMYQRVYESCLRILGPDHWITQEAQGDWKVARTLLESDASSSRSTQVDGLTHLGRHMDLKPSNVLFNLPHPDVHRSPLFRPDSLNANPLCCHQCNTLLTAVTKRFICCVCADHEICGRCYLGFMIGGPEIQRRKSENHTFLPCDLPVENSLPAQEKAPKAHSRPLIKVLGETGVGKSCFMYPVAATDHKKGHEALSNNSLPSHHGARWGFEAETSSRSGKSTSSSESWRWTKLLLDNNWSGDSTVELSTGEMEEVD